MEIEVNGKWVEVLGAGVVQPPVLEKLGIDSEKYNGWAFGFGLERLAIISMDLPDIRLFWSEDERVKKQLKLGNKFVEVSKYPPIVRDISFVVESDFIPNDYFDLVRETAPDLVEEVHLIDKYENVEKFGENMLSYAFRITYRSTERTLTSEEVDTLHKKLEIETAKVFNAKVR
jgi:phenylalanyl-tRNA synthetase alpha chain